MSMGNLLLLFCLISGGLSVLADTASPVNDNSNEVAQKAPAERQEEVSLPVVDLESEKYTVDRLEDFVEKQKGTTKEQPATTIAEPVVEKGIPDFEEQASKVQVEVKVIKQEPPNIVTEHPASEKDEQTLKKEVPQESFESAVDGKEQNEMMAEPEISPERPVTWTEEPAQTEESAEIGDGPVVEKAQHVLGKESIGEKSEELEVQEEDPLIEKETLVAERSDGPEPEDIVVIEKIILADGLVLGQTKQVEENENPVFESEETFVEQKKSVEEHSEEQPLIEEEQQFVDDGQPWADKEETHVEEEWPLLENEQLVEEQPVVDKEEPLLEEEQPMIDKEDTFVEEEQPVIDKEEIFFEEEQPVVDEEERFVEKEQPVIDKEETFVDEEQLVVDKEETFVDEEQLVVDKEEPFVEEQPFIKQEGQYIKKEEEFLDNEESDVEKERIVEPVVEKGEPANEVAEPEYDEEEFRMDEETDFADMELVMDMDESIFENRESEKLVPETESDFPEEDEFYSDKMDPVTEMEQPIIEKAESVEVMDHIREKDEPPVAEAIEEDTQAAIFQEAEEVAVDSEEQHSEPSPDVTKQQEEQNVKHVTRPSEEHVKGTRPNIVILLADGVSKEDMSCYGGNTPTPNINSIAVNGVLLSHHVAGGLTDTSSRAALLTGRLAVRYGMAPDGEPDAIPTMASQTGLPPNETTFAKVLQEAGYTTGLIGKWNLGISCDTLEDLCHHPLNHGFDHFFGFPLINQYSIPGNSSIMTHLQRFFIVLTVAIVMTVLLKFWLGNLAVLILILSVGLALCWSGFCAHNEHIWSSAFMRDTQMVEVPAEYEGASRRLVNEGVRFLKKAKGGDKPFLLFLSWHQLHAKIQASKEFRAETERAGKVRELDWAVGQVLEAVRTLGMDSNTVVYFTSTTPQVHHTKDWGRAVRHGAVPGLLRWAGRWSAGRLVGAPTSHLDLLPTLLRLAGAPPPARRAFDGRDISAELSGQRAAPRIMFHYCGPQLHAVRCSTDEGGAYLGYLFPAVWQHDGAESGPAYCSARPPPAASPAAPFAMFDLGRENRIHVAILETHRKYEQLQALMVESIERHQGEPVVGGDDQFAWFRQTWHVYLQPTCASGEYTCNDTSNALGDTPL